MSLSLKSDSASMLTVGNKQYHYFSLARAAKKLGDGSKLPKSLKVLLENLLRHIDGTSVVEQDLQAIIDWQKRGTQTGKLLTDLLVYSCKTLRVFPQLLTLRRCVKPLSLLGGMLNK